ncbi:MAG: glycosyltransferase family 2 protein [Bacteroidales bacterium]|nr:glycosyltransferase family 2 protein [Bacteroidales bacterium]
MNKRVAIVILNWNGRKMLQEFLPSVVEHSATAQIVVADNGSTDDSVEFLRTNYPQIQLVINDKNYGFAEGYNKALAHVEADYYVILNSDVEVTPNWIEPVVELMESDEKIAICQPKLLSHINRENFEYAGGAGGFIDRFGYPFCRGRVFSTLEKDEGQYDDVREVFWATGAAMFVKAPLFHKLGGFDGDFFAHMEEIDFCWRAKNSGYKVMYCPASKIYHVGGGTLPPSSPFKTFLNFRNNFALLYKNLRRISIAYVFPARIVLDYVAAVRFLTEGKPKEFWAVVRAHFAFYRMVPNLTRKRRKMDHRKVGEIYRGSVVFANFLFKKNKFSMFDEKKFSR